MVSESLTTISFVEPVQEYMPLVEARMLEQSKGHHRDLQSALTHLLNSGGKRVRPTVSLLVGGMISASPERTITLAAAVELLHTATLVHDDMIDGALLRRGIPTLNSKWSPAATILTGDFIFARAAKLAAETNSIEVMNLFANTLSTIVNGEITQMFESKGLASRENYFNRIYAKTASMFELAAVAPIYLGAAYDGESKLLQQYVYHIGVAFQIVDDILDFTGVQSDVGKPVASDLRQGLITLPALCYFENSPDDPNVQAALNGGLGDIDKMDILVESIRESDAISLALDEAKDHIQLGLKIIEKMPISPERSALEDLAEYVVGRQI
ncbi:MAG: polyprenyl synthetase family protein [Chloroflexota bacterium]